MLTCRARCWQSGPPPLMVSRISEEGVDDGDNLVAHVEPMEEVVVHPMDGHSDDDASKLGVDQET